MIKTFSAVILLLFLFSAGFSFSQGVPEGVKIYSGYLHHHVKNKASLWQTFFGPKSVKQEEVIQGSPCSIEFDSPVAFSQQSETVIPQQLNYFIRFKNGPRTFDKFIIKIFTNDDEEYSIDPGSEGKQVGINDEHHIFDAYLIYLILGTNIDHLEIINPSGDDQDKYVLDKLEIHGNQ